MLIADAAGRKRSVSEYLPITAVFDTIVAGLADDLGLLDEVVREPASSMPYAARGLFKQVAQHPAKARQPQGDDNG